MTEGPKTSEFKLSVTVIIAVVVLIAVSMFTGKDVSEIEGLVYGMLGIAGVYTGGRSIAKLTNGKGTGDATP
jgi:hypothetical protein